MNTKNKEHCHHDKTGKCPYAYTTTINGGIPRAACKLPYDKPCPGGKTAKAVIIAVRNRRLKILQADINGLAKTAKMVGGLAVIAEDVAAIVNDLLVLGVDISRIKAATEGKW